MEYFYQRLIEIPIIHVLDSKKNEIEKIKNHVINNNCNIFLEKTSIN